MSIEEVLNCPFCGRPYKKSEESVVWLETEYCATYYCLCGCEKMGSGSTESKAIDSLRYNWNRRPDTKYEINMEKVNLTELLERQGASIEFRNGKVKYFSWSTQHGTANTIYEAIEDIVIADEKYDGKTPFGCMLDEYESKIEVPSIDSEYNQTNLQQVIDTFFKTLNH